MKADSTVNRWSVLSAMAMLPLVLALSVALSTILAADDGDWLSYAADKASTKYSPLDQINKHNVKDLQIAWRWESLDYELEKTFPSLGASTMFETTPLVVDGNMFTCTGQGQVAAINPESGQTQWSYNPFEGYSREDRPRHAGFPVCRGLTYWTKDGKERLFVVGDQHLISVDVETGRPDPEFGESGRVDMRKGLGRRLRSYFWTSPPLVCNDVIVMGNSTTDPYHLKKQPKGQVRGYSAITGELLWVFRVIPRKGEFGYETWEDGSAEYTGHANVWSWMSCDEQLDYVYLPTSTPNDDWYGGHRKGDGLFGESIVCLNAKTGERVWHFQAVHHGLWDYDFPCAPVLCDINVAGKPIKALAQVSKQAFCYVLDRVTGEPVWPIEERPVPASTVPGEQAAKTQPHPTRPAPFDRQGISEDDLIDFTPELRARALEVFKDYVAGPIFTPPIVANDKKLGKKAALQVPAAIGGANWNGAALDPETNILYVPSVTTVQSIAVAKPSRVGDVDYMISFGGGEFSVTLDGLPIVKPPYGRITAIDLNTGDHVWMVANGDGYRDHPLLEGLDLPPLGQPGRAGALVTKTLLFVGEGSPDMIAIPEGGGGNMLRAYDKATGDVVAEIELPAPATGSPMSYISGGKQYIVIAVGSRDAKAQYLAYALPDKGRPRP